MPTTSSVEIKVVTVGLPEGGSARTVFTQKNTTGSRITAETTFGIGVAAATSFVTPTNAKFMTIVMPTTNQSGWRLAFSTAEVGLPMSSQGASVLCLPATTLGTTFYAYSTSTRAISGVRLLFS